MTNLYDASTVRGIYANPAQLINVDEGGFRLISASLRLEPPVDPDAPYPLTLVRFFDALALPTDNAALRGFYYVGPDDIVDLNYDLVGGVTFYVGLLIVSTAFASWTTDPSDPPLAADGPPILGTRFTKPVRVGLNPSSAQR